MEQINSGEASAIGGVGLVRAIGGMPGHSLGNPSIMGHPGGGPDLARNGHNVNFGGQLPIGAVSRPRPETIPLPPDASCTLYVEGLPSDSTKREVARILFLFFLSKILLINCIVMHSPVSHGVLSFLLYYTYSLMSYLDIFRPFVGYREVRLVSKESKHVSAGFATVVGFFIFFFQIVYMIG